MKEVGGFKTHSYLHLHPHPSQHLPSLPFLALLFPMLLPHLLSSLPFIPILFLHLLLYHLMLT